MEVEERTHQIEKWRMGRNVQVVKISGPREVVSFQVMTNPRPVIEALQQERDIPGGLELNHR